MFIGFYDKIQTYCGLNTSLKVDLFEYVVQNAELDTIQNALGSKQLCHKPTCQSTILEICAAPV